MGLALAGVKFCPSPLSLIVVLTTLSHYRASVWCNADWFRCILNSRSGRALGQQYGAGEGEIWYDELQCEGSETDLARCIHSGLAQHNCEHHEDVSISCVPSKIRRNCSWNSCSDGWIDYCWNTYDASNFTFNEVIQPISVATWRLTTLQMHLAWQCKKDKVNIFP